MQIMDPSEGQYYIPIKWYFAPHNAKTYPYVQSFTSGIWDRDKPEQPPELGEQPPYAAPYYKGDNTWGYLGQCVIGSPDQFNNGLSAADLASLPPPKPACCQNVQPAINLGNLQFDIRVKAGYYSPPANLGTFQFDFRVVTWSVTINQIALGIRIGLAVRDVHPPSVLAPLKFAIGLPVPPPIQLQAGCVAFWPMHESSGVDRADATGNGNTLTQPGIPVAQTTGLIGFAARLDVGSYLLSPVGPDGLSPWSVSFWYDPDVGSSNDWLFVDGTNTIDFYNNLTDFAVDADGVVPHSGLPELGLVYHHMCVTFDGGTYRLYRDGVLLSQLLWGGPFSAGGPVTIGGFSGVYPWAHGGIQLMGLWSRALNDGGIAIGSNAQGEVGRLYNGGAGLDWPL